MSFLSERGRVARVLLQLAASVGRPLPRSRVEIRHPVRNSEFASMAGVTRESVSRFISQWRRERLVSLSPQGTIVFNRAELEAALAEETNPGEGPKGGG